MPRTLPWLANKSAAKKTATSSSSPAPKRRKRESSPEDLVDSDLNDVAIPPPRPKQRQRADRDPSTSPAAARSPANAPAVEYMRPGAYADDKYMMVEDEFQAVAKSYTQHIHHAEWVRLKRLAKSRGEKTLSALGHGTDGRTAKSRALQIRDEREANEKRIEEALKSDGSEDEEDLPYLRDPQLAGLMGKKGRGIGKELAGMVKTKSNTRAAAGFKESPHTVTRYRDALHGDDSEGRARRATVPNKPSSSKVAHVFEEEDVDDDEDDLDVKPAISPPRPKKESSRATSRVSDDNSFKRFAAPPKDCSLERDTGKTDTGTRIKIEDDEDGWSLPAPKPFVPSYKRFQNRHASNGPEKAPSARDQVRSPLKSTAGHENSASKDHRSSEPSVAHLHSTSATKKPSSILPGANADAGTSETKAAAAGYLAKRAADRARNAKKQQEQSGKAKQIDDIPTFMF